MPLKWDKLIALPPDAVERVCAKITEHREKQLRGFVNPILREDIFDILGNYCTVVYFPFPGEANDGFDISCPVSYLDEGRAHFVFINTDKPIEKQVFAAGHELGHIWEISRLIWDGSDPAFEAAYPQADYEESAMNRFAAELLMPAGHFQNAAGPLIRQYRKGSKIGLDHFALLVAALMNEFCVPAKAVIRRLYETRKITEQLCRRFIDETKEDSPERRFQDDFDRRLRTCIEGRGFTRLGVRTRKKGIRDFPQILDEMERERLFSDDKLRALRTLLEIEPMQAASEELELGDQSWERGGEAT